MINLLLFYFHRIRQDRKREKQLFSYLVGHNMRNPQLLAAEKRQNKKGQGGMFYV